MHVNQLPADWYFALNVNIKPFNQIKARQAVNLAIDRNEIVKLFGGAAARRADVPGAAARLPRLFARTARGRAAARRPGRRPTWRAPRSSSPSRAPRATGSTSWSRNDRVQKAIGQYIFVVLFKLGYDPRLKSLPDGVQAAYVQNSRNQVEVGLSQWHQEYPAPSELLDGLLGCDSFVPDSDASPNISGFCDRKTVQPLMQRAVDARPHAPAGRRAAVAPGRPPRRRSRRVAAALQPEADRPRLAPRGQLPLEPAAAPHAVPALGHVDERRGTGRGQARRADGPAPGDGALDERERRRAAVHAAARRAHRGPARAAPRAQERRARRRR